MREGTVHLMKRIRSNVEPHDVVGLAGLGLTTAGLAMVYVPAALIVPGAVLTVFAVWSAGRSTRREV